MPQVSNVLSLLLQANLCLKCPNYLRVNTRTDWLWNKNGMRNGPHKKSIFEYFNSALEQSAPFTKSGIN